MYTEQQIPPEYKPQVTGSTRLLSAFIDYLPLILLWIVSIPFLFGSLFSSIPNHFDPQDPSSAIAVFDSMKNVYLYMSIFMAIGYTYFLCKDLFGGRSIGKRYQGLQLVRNKTNIPLSNIRMVLRNLFVFIWIIELIMYFANTKQRLGDMTCDTTVVYASENNKQTFTNQKVVITILIVFICTSILAFLYYEIMCLYFNFISSMIEYTMKYQ